ncbi:MAG: acetyl-CoA C-acyltransferase [Candidatus Zixiibacteriota bacterium]|nr:MAG: acetyl-CoA C-acyltransferase [candidate division Zixibacteria bacterium]HDL04203.1 acetyl-CoA C-acetyltransferase [candidate division Zixibacteria bacterium]
MVADRDAYIVSACRSAIGTFLGGLSKFTATQLGAMAIKEAVKRAGIDPVTIDEVIMGQVVQAGLGQAPARQAAVHGGVPVEVPAMTINKVCGSGLKAVMLAASEIRAGNLDCLVAGGMESMSGTPYVLHGAKGGLRFGDKKLQDSMVLDGLWCSFKNWHMGSAAELTGRKSEISREEQDEFAYNSHKKAVAAIEQGKFKDEIFPVEIPQRKGDPVVFDQDECPRPKISMEGLARLKPAFEKDGTVTAGNAPGLNDGSSATVVVSGKYLKANNLTPLARVIDYCSVGIDPELIFYSPIYAVRKLMEKTGVSDINHYDLIEANEAFSVQALADGKELGWDWDRVNVHGGAVALGHPIGASGARVLTTLIYALKDRGLKNGLATLCLGGGCAVAMSIEIV